MNNPYIKSFQIALQDRMQYSTDFLIQFFSGFLYHYAKVAIWFAILMVNKGQVDQLTINDTIMYMILASASGTIYFFAVPTSEITQRVRSGEIGRDLVYPISLPISLFFRSLGGVCTIFLTQVLPAMVILTAIFQPNWPFELVNVLGLLVGAVFGYMLYFLINLQVDMISFWWIETFYFHYIKDAVFRFLSGTLVPLWFFPQWLYRIIEWLPFKNVVYTPIAFYLGRITVQEFLVQMGIQVCWLILLIGVTYLMWKKGTEKVVVQGG